MVGKIFIMLLLLLGTFCNGGDCTDENNNNDTGSDFVDSVLSVDSISFDSSSSYDGDDDTYMYLTDAETHFLPKKNTTIGFIIFSTILYLTSIVICIKSITFIGCYRNNPIVKIGQPHFLVSLCLGSISMSIGGLCWIAAEADHFNTVFVNNDDVVALEEEEMTTTENQKTKDQLCIAWAWMIVMGHTIMYLTLFGKLWRIKRVLRMKRGITVTTNQAIWPLRITLLLNIFILMAWTIVDPPQYIRIDNIIDDDDPSTSYSVGTCDFLQYEFFVPTSIIVILSAATGIWMAYDTRKLPEELSEGKRIFRVYLTNFISFMVFGTFYYYGRFKSILPLMNLGILIGVFLTALGAVLEIIGPRMYYVWYEKKHGHLPEGVLTIGQGRVHVNITPGVEFTTTTATASDTNPPSIIRRHTSPPPLPPEEEDTKDDDNSDDVVEIDNVVIDVDASEMVTSIHMAAVATSMTTDQGSVIAQKVHHQEQNNKQHKKIPSNGTDTTTSATTVVDNGDLQSSKSTIIPPISTVDDESCNYNRLQLSPSDDEQQQQQHVTNNDESGKTIIMISSGSADNTAGDENDKNNINRNDNVNNNEDKERYRVEDENLES